MFGVSDFWRWRGWRYIWMIIFGGMLAGKTAVLHAQSPVLALASEADYTYGQEIRFHLTGQVDQPVAEINLFMQAPELPHTFAVAVSLPESSADVLDVWQTVDLTQLRLAPFTTVTYWWSVRFVSGEELETAEQHFRYEDNQFVWREVTRDGITAHWTGDDATLGQLVVDVIVEATPRLARWLPVEQPMVLDVYVYPSAADLRAALRLTGRDWVGAHAEPELGVLLVTAVNSRTAATDLRRSVPHELTHWLLYQAVTANYESVPLWFNEGLATLAESSPDPVYDLLLETAVNNNDLIPFSQLCHQFPTSRDEALLAYAQSVSLVSYIQLRYGDSAIRQMVDAFADGADCETAVFRTLNLTLNDLVSDWLDQQQTRSPFTRFWLENRLWLILLLGSFAITTLLLLSNRQGDIQ
ncbi:MAG: hypothetical protein D6706_16305 [Chloroflexi bacterium]|nr:MAG: hypothetical protein D6706_16305 [Chloroflexota bacterium]